MEVDAATAPTALASTSMFPAEKLINIERVYNFSVNQKYTFLPEAATN
jgi:hypothetical protein